MKPKLRIDAFYDIRSKLLEALENVSEEFYIYRCCLTCENFNEQLEICKLANQRPPVRVITFGCPKWYDKKEIPF